MAWSQHLQGAGPNRGLVLTGWASDDSGPVPVAVDPATGRLLTSTTGGGGGGGTSSNFGSAFPAAGTALGAIGSTGNMTGLTLTAAGNLKVDGSSVTQPVSGTFWQATQPVSGTVTANAGTNLNTSTLALETGGNLAAIKTDVDKIPSQGQALAAGSMPVVLTAAQITTLTPPAAITGFALETGGNLAAIKTDVDKIPALGQALAASSVPVVLTAAQLTTLTPPAAITGFALDATLTGGTQQTKITDGTNVANVLANDTGLNGQVVNSATKTYTFTTSASGAQTILANTDCRGFSWVEVVYTSVGSGLALTGQFAPNSGGTYINQNSWAPNTGTANTNVLGTTVSTVYTSPVKGNYFQIAVSALTSGTFSGYVTLRTVPAPLASVNASITGTATVNTGSATGSAVPANAFYMGLNDGTNLVGYKDAVAVSAGSGVGIGAVGIFGGIMPIGTLLNTYSAQITTNTTTTPTSATAYISGIVVSVTTAGTTSTVTIKDKQGTPLTLINTLSTAALSVGDMQFTFQTPVKMVSGIDIVTAGAAAATFSIFINYYQ